MSIRNLVAALLVVGVVAAAHADPALDRIAARGYAVVSVKNEGRRRQDAHKDPAHFQKRDFEVALAREIAAALPGDPKKLELRMMRRPERLPAVAEGRVDQAGLPVVEQASGLVAWAERWGVLLWLALLLALSGGLALLWRWRVREGVKVLAVLAYVGAIWLVVTRV